MFSSSSWSDWAKLECALVFHAVEVDETLHNSFVLCFYIYKKKNVFLWLLSTRLFCCNINYTWSHINYDSSSGLIKFDEIPTRIYVPIYTYSNNNWYIISFIYICCKLKQLHCFIISCLWWFNKKDDLINMTLQIYVNNIASIRIIS